MRSMSSKAPLRVAMIQLDPKIGEVEGNIRRATELCSKIVPRSVDLCLLPELAFTGYVFPNASAIQPHLEAPRTGPTSRFCEALARRLECYVAVGYPERLKEDECEVDVEGVKKIGANSAIVYGPKGEFVSGYRKTNLFSTDMTWAIAGTGFLTLRLPPPLNTITLGICMDLNPLPPGAWMTLDGPYEIADHVIASKSTVLVLLNAWLDSKREPEEDEDWDTLNYWAARLQPLWEKKPEESEPEPIPRTPTTTVLICNRSGVENDTTFAGTSSVFRLTRGLGKPKLVQAAPRRGEGVFMWTEAL